jgi:hypothetical protein
MEEPALSFYISGHLLCHPMDQLAFFTTDLKRFPLPTRVDDGRASLEKKSDHKPKITHL